MPVESRVNCRATIQTLASGVVSWQALTRLDVTMSLLSFRSSLMIAVVESACRCFSENSCKPACDAILNPPPLANQNGGNTRARASLKRVLFYSSFCC